MSTRQDSLISGKDISKVYRNGKQEKWAVNHASFDFQRGEIISIVGESGSGKTTLARVVLGLEKATEGEIYYCGSKRDMHNDAACRAYWKNVQAIFQDPFASFNIFNKVDTLLLDCIKFSEQYSAGDDVRTDLMRQACKFVNLKFEDISSKYPFELSGGQMQRLMIARIFLLKPKLVIADEPTSMVDACSRATILDMLLKLRSEENMTIVFITHDIGLAYYVSDTVYIMKDGKFAEQGHPDDVIINPKEEYTKKLINDVPKIYNKWDYGK